MVSNVGASRRRYPQQAAHDRQVGLVAHGRLLLVLGRDVQLEERVDRRRPHRRGEGLGRGVEELLGDLLDVVAHRELERLGLEVTVDLHAAEELGHDVLAALEAVRVENTMNRVTTYDLRLLMNMNNTFLSLFMS